MSDDERALLGTRMETARRVADELISGQNRGTLLLGDAGLGKTSIAGVIASLVENRYNVHHVYGSTTLSSVPFGALGSFLGGLSAEAVDSPVAVLRQLKSALGADEGETPTLLVVDDAHHLDESSAAVIAQLVTSGGLRLLALARPVGGLPVDLVQLANDGLLGRLTLEPLTDSRIQKLCEIELGGPVLQSVGSYLTMASAGNPMMAKALIDLGLRSGSLVKRRGVWILVGEFPSVDLPLAEVIRRELIGRTPAERRVMEMVALADPLPLSVVEQMDSLDEVQALEADNILNVSGGEQPLVRPTHPLYGELVRQLVPQGRSLLIRQELMKFMDFDHQSFEGLLHHVAWSLDCGARVPDEQLVRAAKLANHLYNSNFALRAASAVTDPDLLDVARAAIARAYFGRGDTARALEMCESLAATSTDLSVLYDAISVMAMVHLQTVGLPKDLREDAALWRTGIERARETQEAFGELESEASYTSSWVGARLIETAALILETEYDGLVEELEEILEKPGINSAVRVVALSQLGEVLGWTGRPESGVRRTQRAFALMQEDTALSMYYEYVMTRHVIAALHVPRWDEIVAVMGAYTARGAANLLFFGGSANFVQGTVAVLRGRISDGLTRLVPAVEALRESDVENVLPLALGVTAFAASLSGDEALVQRCREDFEWLPARSRDQKYLLAQAFMILSTAPTEGIEQAVEQLMDLADACLPVTQSVAEMDIHLFAAIVAPLRNPERVAELTADIEGKEAALLQNYARAMLDRDPEALVQTAATAETVGYSVVGLHAMQAAAEIYVQQGQPAKARRLQGRIVDLTRTLGLGTPNSPGGPDLSVLTKREQQITEYVRTGLSNKEIAESMRVSVRTVEGHLYRIYPKLGVSNREELASVIDSGAQW